MSWDSVYVHQEGAKNSTLSSPDQAVVQLALLALLADAAALRDYV